MACYVEASVFVPKIQLYWVQTTRPLIHVICNQEEAGRRRIMHHTYNDESKRTKLNMDPELCVFIGEALSRYHFGASHPFGPARYPAFVEEFERRGLEQRVNVVEPGMAGEEDLALFHSHDYIARVRELSALGYGLLDYGDTPAVPGIYEAAAAVVGTTLKAVDLVMQGQCRRAFNPIGGLHHARHNQAAGFCVFNDCAVAIEALRQRHGIRRIAYVDIDAHHGDGVYYAFEADADLHIVDFHEDGHYLYPGTGFAEESGSGKARGTKLNIPLPPGCNDEAALDLWEKAEDFIDRSEPEFILLQCGADSLAGDPITHLQLSGGFHGHVATRLVMLAQRHARGRMVAVGGGGYTPENIAEAWNDVIEGMLG
jgi:acetoin utilization protein AcuC